MLPALYSWNTQRVEKIATETLKGRKVERNDLTGWIFKIIHENDEEWTVFSGCWQMTTEQTVVGWHTHNSATTKEPGKKKSYIYNCVVILNSYFLKKQKKSSMGKWLLVALSSSAWTCREWQQKFWWVLVWIDMWQWTCPHGIIEQEWTVILQIIHRYFVWWWVWFCWPAEITRFPGYTWLGEQCINAEKIQVYRVTVATRYRSL